LSPWCPPVGQPDIPDVGAPGLVRPRPRGFRASKQGSSPLFQGEERKEAKKVDKAGEVPAVES